MARGSSGKLAAILPVLVVALAAVLALRRLDNTDTWWHLAAGRWIAGHAAVPHADTLSSTVAGRPWTDLQWLFELTLYGLYRVGGVNLLVLGAALVHALATALLVVNLRGALGGVGTAAIALWVTAIAQERFAIRPEMMSFLLLETVLWLCATGEPRCLWFLPAVMLVWVNSHALFVVGAFVIVCYMVGTAATQSSLVPAGWRAPPDAVRLRRMLMAGTAALLVTLVNPYGPSGVAFPVKLMSRINGSNPIFQSVGEFQPPFSGYFVTSALRAYQYFLVFGVAAAVLAAIVTLRGAAGRDSATVRFDLPGLGIFVGLGAVSLLARRNIALFALGAAPFVARSLAAVHEHVPPRARQAGDLATRALALVMGPVLVAAGWFVVSNGFYRWNSLVHEFGMGMLPVFPDRAAAFARQMKLRPPLFNDLTSGGYLAWDRPLDSGVYIDGRLEVYDIDFLSHYVDDLAVPDRWEADAEAAGIQTVVFGHWWPNHEALIRHLYDDPRWALVYFDDVALVFVRLAGNEDLIAHAQAASRPLVRQAADELLQPVTGWQVPVARLRRLSTYASLLDLMDQPDQAARFYTRLMDLGPLPENAADIAIRLAQYHADRGETSLARTYLGRAVAADPGNPGIAWMAARLGR